MISLSIQFTQNNTIVKKNSLDNKPEQIFAQSGSYGSDLDNDQLVTGVDYIDAEIVWNGYDGGLRAKERYPGGQGIRVAVLDSGIDLDHPDLVRNIEPGYDFYSNDTSPQDTYGHGTHCAGIIAATPRGSANGLIGIAPFAKIVPLRTGDESPSEGKVIEAIEWCIAKNNDSDDENDIDIISISVTCNSTNIGNYAEDAREAGIIIVSTIGSTTSGTSLLGISDDVISVSYLDTTKDPPELGEYALRSPYLDFVAPGTLINSTYINGGYTPLSGPSMATPMVAGTIALLLSTDNDLANDISNFTEAPVMANTTIYSILAETADDLGNDLPDFYYGYGCIDAYAAFQKVNDINFWKDTDVDNDGLYCGLEDYYGTSDSNNDTDSDGYSDWDEVIATSNTTDANFIPTYYPYSEEFNNNYGWWHNNESMTTINNGLLNISTNRKLQNDYSYKRILSSEFDFELKFRYNTLNREANSQTYIGLVSHMDGTYDTHLDGLYFHHYGGSSSTSNKIKFDLIAKVNGTTTTTSVNYYLADANTWYIVYLRKTGEQVSLIVADANDQTIYFSSQTLNAPEIAPLRFLYAGGSFTNTTGIGYSCLDNIEFRTSREDLLSDYFVADDDQWNHTDENAIRVSSGGLKIHTDCNSDDDYSFRSLNLSQNFELRFTYTRNTSGDAYSRIFIGFTSNITVGGESYPAGTYDDLTDGIFFRFYDDLLSRYQSFHLYTKVNSTEYVDEDEYEIDDWNDGVTYQIVLQKLNTYVSMQIWDDDESELLSEQSVTVSNMPQLHCLYVGGEYTGYSRDAYGTVDNINVTDMFYDHYDDFSDDKWTHVGNKIYVDTTLEQMNITTVRSLQTDYSYYLLPIPENFELIFHYTPLSSDLCSDLYIGVAGVNSTTGLPDGTREKLTDAIFLWQYGGLSVGNQFFKLNPIIDSTGSTSTAYTYDVEDEYKVSIIKNGSSATLTLWEVGGSSNSVYNATLNVTSIGDLGCLYVGGRYTGSNKWGNGIMYDIQFRELPLHSGITDTQPDIEKKVTNSYTTPLVIVLGIFVLADFLFTLVHFRNIKRTRILSSKSLKQKPNKEITH